MTLKLDPDRVAARDAMLAGLGPRPPWWRPIQRRRWARRRAAILAMDVTWAGSMLRAVYPALQIEALASRQHPALGAIIRYRPEKP